MGTMYGRDNYVPIYTHLCALKNGSNQEEGAREKGELGCNLTQLSSIVTAVPVGHVSVWL